MRGLVGYLSCRGTKGYLELVNVVRWVREGEKGLFAIYETIILSV